MARAWRSLSCFGTVLLLSVWPTRLAMAPGEPAPEAAALTAALAILGQAPLQPEGGCRGETAVAPPPISGPPAAGKPHEPRSTGMCGSAPRPSWGAWQPARPGLTLEGGAPSLRLVTALSRHHPAGASEALLRFAQPGGDLHLTLVMTAAARHPAPAGLFVATARRAAASGAALVRLGRPFALATRFGVLEAAEAVIDENGRQACLAFEGGEGAATIAGWSCSGAGAAPEPRLLACLLDRLSLVADAADETVRSLITGTARQRDPACAGEAASEAAAAAAAVRRTPAPRRSRGQLGEKRRRGAAPLG